MPADLILTPSLAQIGAELYLGPSARQSPFFAFAQTPMVMVGTWDIPRRELVDITAEIRGETDKAPRLFDGMRTEWVPKSQVEDNGDGTFTMPEWVARDKGFI